MNLLAAQEKLNQSCNEALIYCLNPQLCFKYYLIRKHGYDWYLSYRFTMEFWHGKALSNFAFGPDND